MLLNMQIPPVCTLGNEQRTVCEIWAKKEKEGENVKRLITITIRGQDKQKNEVIAKKNNTPQKA